MNRANVLMCWDVPPISEISEELLYELFCVAGPIEDISLSNSGRSCFIVYDDVEAVITAKEIFEGIKLNGRKLQMFCEKDIEELYATLTERRDNYNKRGNENGAADFPNKRSHYNMRVQLDPRLNDSSMPFNFQTGYCNEVVNRLSSYSPSPFEPSNSQHRFDKNVPPKVWEDEWTNTRKSSLSNMLNSCRETYQRPDLLPTPSRNRSSHYDGDIFVTSHNEFSRESEKLFSDMINPYSTPVSRNDYRPNSSINNRESRFGNSDSPFGMVKEESSRRNDHSGDKSYQNKHRNQYGRHERYDRSERYDRHEQRERKSPYSRNHPNSISHYVGQVLKYTKPSRDNSRSLKDNRYQVSSYRSGRRY